MIREAAIGGERRATWRDALFGATETGRPSEPVDCALRASTLSLRTLDSVHEIKIAPELKATIFFFCWKITMSDEPKKI